MKKVELSPPWITFAREVEAMFKDDPDVTVVQEEETVLNIYVSKYDKCEALKDIVPAEKDFGSVTMTINVIYRSASKKTAEEIYNIAFEGNSAFKYACTVDLGTNPLTYVVFKKDVVQYWNDDMSDPHGVTSTLYENIARDMFKSNSGVVFSTDSEVNEIEVKPETNKFETIKTKDGHEALKVNSIESFKEVFRFDNEKMKDVQCKFKKK